MDVNINVAAIARFEHCEISTRTQFDYGLMTAEPPGSHAQLTNDSIQTLLHK